MESKPSHDEREMRKEESEREKFMEIITNGGDER